MKNMPKLGEKCVASFNQSLQIASATEALWRTAPPTSEVRKQLKTPQLEALYEATFLRIFSAYEAFLEDVLTHFMARYRTASYEPVAAQGSNLHNSLSSAGSALLGNRSFLLWHNPSRAIDLSKRHLIDCPVEVVLDAQKGKIADYAAVRHHIAHNSSGTKARFCASALQLTGNDYRGLPGKLLRSENISDPLNPTKWIRTITDSMSEVVLDICP